MNLGVTARSLVDSYRTYRSDGRVEPLEEFVASAVAAFRCAYSLDVVLMELDLAEEASSEDRTARRDWLRTVRTTLTTVDTLGDDAAATPTDALAERVATVVAAAASWGRHGVRHETRAGSTIQRRSAGAKLAVQRASGGQADRKRW